ncbi:hypothetical protein MHYP_G00036470 [Metynnis hypsauchen]
MESKPTSHRWRQRLEGRTSALQAVKSTERDPDDLILPAPTCASPWHTLLPWAPPADAQILTGRESTADPRAVL